MCCIVMRGTIFGGTVIGGAIIRAAIVKGTVIKCTVIKGTVINGAIVEGTIDEGTIVEGTDVAPYWRCCCCVIVRGVVAIGAPMQLCLKTGEQATAERTPKGVIPRHTLLSCPSTNPMIETMTSASLRPLGIMSW